MFDHFFNNINLHFLPVLFPIIVSNYHKVTITDHPVHTVYNKTIFLKITEIGQQKSYFLSKKNICFGLSLHSVYKLVQ